MNNHQSSVPELAQKLDTLPDRPGVYIYRSSDGKVIYVGKAVVLRNRVRSYFHEAARHEPRTRRLVTEIADLEWIVTDTELEALILENELIKRYRPRFNVRLRDDKTYPYIKIHWQEDFPKVSIVRRMERDGARYYGPFTSAYAVRQTLDVLRRVFPYLDCNREITGQRPQALPLLPHQALRRSVHRRGGQGRLPPDGERAERLSGRRQRARAANSSSARMQDAAENLQFERAAQLRDQIRAARQIVERQKIVSGKQEDEDVIAFAQDERTGEACVQVFFIRRGKLIGRESFVLEGVPPEANGELIAAFVKQFYDEAAFVPPSILLPKDLDERKIIEQWLRGRRGGQKVKLTVPKRGAKHELLQLASENAAATLSSLAGPVAGRHEPADRGPEPDPGGARTAGAAEPDRMLRHLHPAGHEHRRQHGRLCEGRSARRATIAGSTSRAAAVRANRTTTPRCARCCAAAFAARSRKPSHDPGSKARSRDAAWKLLPDLLIVDGGKGQLGVAIEVLAEFGLTEVVPVVGLAKQREELFLPGRCGSDPAAAGDPGPVSDPTHSRRGASVRHHRAP